MNRLPCVTALSLALSLTACTDSGTPPQAAPKGPHQTVVATGLAHPWDIAFLSAGEALVTEKDGRLKLVDLRSGETRVVDGLPSDVDNVRRNDPRDNSGLFSVELDPSFTENRWVYVAYSAGDADGTALRVVRGRWDDNASLSGIEEILAIAPLSADRFHYGGGLVFGSDGKLYVTAGERFFNEVDQPALPVAQDLSDMRGKIYRINPDGSIPDDNPVFGEPAVPGVYALGIRASQGMVRHPASGEIWFSEHGSMQGDEINVLRPGANYGWPVVTTGRYRSSDYAPPRLDRDFAGPVHSWEHTVAPTGLTFYTGGDFPEWNGDLFVAGLAGGSLWRLEIDGGTVTGAHAMFEEEPVRLRNVQQSPDGVLYLLTDEPNGRIVRLDAR